MLLLSSVMGGATYFLHAGLERWLGGGGLVAEAARLLTAILAGVLVLLAGLRLVNLPDTRFLFSFWRRR